MRDMMWSAVMRRAVRVGFTFFASVACFACARGPSDQSQSTAELPAELGTVHSSESIGPLPVESSGSRSGSSSRSHRPEPSGSPASSLRGSFAVDPTGPGSAESTRSHQEPQPESVDPIAKERQRVLTENARLAHTRIRALNVLDAFLSNRIPGQFAQLDDPYEFPGPDGRSLILSGVGRGSSDPSHPFYMTYEEAVDFCSKMGGGARLPSFEDYIALSQAMGSSSPLWDAADFNVAGYNSSLISNNWIDFWASGGNPNCRYYFTGNKGVIFYRFPFFRLAVRCVVDG